MIGLNHLNLFKGDNMKKYIALFKVYNGDCSYDMYITHETNTKKEAESWFKDFECDNMNEIWILRTFKEVKTFNEIWEFMR